MKLKEGNVYRTKRAPPWAADGWLWVYGGKIGAASYLFTSVATGNRTVTIRPREWFEEDEDEAGEG